MKNKLSRCALIVFDFDGVLTNNKVLVFEDGREAVTCNRGDGLAFNIFRKNNIPALILSTETNPIVAVRGKKMGVPVLQGVSDKAEALAEYCAAAEIPLEATCFIGNDVNDESVMRIVGLRLCPKDAHPKILAICDYVIPVNGGDGVARHIADLIASDDHPLN